jgi:hypothetical protein
MFPLFKRQWEIQTRTEIFFRKVPYTKYNVHSSVEWVGFSIFLIMTQRFTIIIWWQNFKNVLDTMYKYFVAY